MSRSTFKELFKFDMKQMNNLYVLFLATCKSSGRMEESGRRERGHVDKVENRESEH